MWIPVIVGLWIANNARLIHKDRAKVKNAKGDAYAYSVRNLLTKSIQGKLSVGG